jgi:hypothetical protein
MHRHLQASKFARSGEVGQACCRKQVIGSYHYLLFRKGKGAALSKSPIGDACGYLRAGRRPGTVCL